ncbi:MAG: hypothetical protein WBD27_12340 [Pyrinomonadaceae bacterium]
MKQQELETLARDVVNDILQNNDVEDSRFELKASWLDSEKAAQRLGAHANASRGENVIWIIGVDEKRRTLTDLNIAEKGNWLKSVEKHFDGFAPRMLLDVNFTVQDKKLVALLFETEKEAPFVIKSSQGGFPQFFVPWRVGTDMRAARREDLLSLLVPIQRLASLIREVKFNRAIAKGSFGSLFRTQEFFKALQDGLLETLSSEVEAKITETYVKIENANQRISSYHLFSGNWNGRGALMAEAKRLFEEIMKEIVELDELLNNHRSKISVEIEEIL